MSTNVDLDDARRRGNSVRRWQSQGQGLALSLVTWLLACAPAVQQPEPPSAAEHLDLDGAVAFVTRDLVDQLGPVAQGDRAVVIDPLLDGLTGQQTWATAEVQDRFRQSLAAAPQMSVLEFHPEALKQVHLVIAGTITNLGEDNEYRLSIALTDTRSGIVVARAVAPFHEAGLDDNPTPYFSDSPSLVRDRTIEGYLSTVDTEVGAPADALYVEQIPTAALLADALAAYNEQRWEDALSLYSAAAERPDGQQLRTFNGIYLANIQLGHDTNAESAFQKIVALGLATNNLAVKLLFTPGRTDFWSDEKVNGVYPMWLRQIAQTAQDTGNCLQVVGHTSRSGTEPFNERLSLARAKAIRTRLNRESPGLARRVAVKGVGYRENLVGSGADDASDALDRRVEFKVIECGAVASSSATP